MSGYEVNEPSQEVVGAIVVHMTDLIDMDATDQLMIMRKWFLDNYEDPVHSLPYESREGGYIWLDGGPYDPHEELHEKFGEFVPEAVIEELGDELFAESHQWAAQVDLSDEDAYGIDYIAEAAEYFNEYRLAMNSNRALLDIDVPEAARSTFYGMAFVNVITIMETYLSDTFTGLVLNSEGLLRKFVVSTPEFKKQRFPLSEIYDHLDDIAETAKEHLEGIVWHRLDKVSNMYRDTLGVSFPERLDDIYRAIIARHALVHRNGKHDGRHLAITKANVQELTDKVDGFVVSISEQIKQADAYDLLF